MVAGESDVAEQAEFLRTFKASETVSKDSTFRPHPFAFIFWGISAG